MQTKISTKIKNSPHIYALKIKTESNGLGVAKTLIVLGLIFGQATVLILLYLSFLNSFLWYFVFSIVITVISCIHVLSSDYHGQAKATWIFFLMFCFGFAYIFYIMSDKRVLYSRAKRKMNKIRKQNVGLQNQPDLSNVQSNEIKTNCQYLYNVGNFAAHTSSKTTYYPSGSKLFDNILETLENAKEFIFLEYYIVADGVLLNRCLDILKQKVVEGVDVRMIYDDFGSHKTLKHKTKKKIKSLGIKLESFNKMIPIFNIALNFRDHRKIVVVDGKVGFTSGANLADEYTNEKRMHGYWKDEGIKIEGSAVDNFTISFLAQWEFLTRQKEDYTKYINKAKIFESDGVVVPYVSGPSFDFSIAQNMYANLISNAEEKLYIMTPYFVPDETINNLLINKAKSGVDVRVILPDVPDKNFVYTVSRNNAERLLEHGVKVYTMTSSFVHSKVVYTEDSAVVGSINFDLRSFYQQFESAVFTNEIHTLKEIANDFEFALNHCKEITTKNQKRNKLSFRILAGLFKIVSTFM